MKKSFISLVLVFILAGALLISASAASFEHLADDLNALGLFQGTGSGYDLDSAPNRGQALVMLIRLYGLEEEAKVCEAEHPFTDLTGASAWLEPYVAFAYENGFTKGTSDTTFSPTLPCTAQMYVTYVLRALGYSDSEEDGDFTWADALDFGYELGIADSLLAEGDFLRDQMVAVSYLALLAEPKDEEYASLLEKLVADGAVSEAAAAAFISKLELLYEFMSVGSELTGEASMSMIVKVAADMGILGSANIDMDMSYILTGADIQLVIDGNMNMNMMGNKTSMPIKVYLVDGIMYIDMEGQKIMMDSGLGDIGDTVDIAAAAQLGLTPYIFSEIKKEVKGDYTVYTAKIADNFFDSIVDAAMGAMSGADLGDIDLGGMGLGGIDPGDMELSIASPEFSYYTDSGGALKKVDMAIKMTMMMDLNGIKLPITIKISMEMEITAVGDAVEIVLPDDLDTYIDYNDLVPDDPAA